MLQINLTTTTWQFNKNRPISAIHFSSVIQLENRPTFELFGLKVGHSATLKGRKPKEVLTGKNNNYIVLSSFVLKSQVLKLRGAKAG